MHENSGLADTADYDSVLGCNLKSFFEKNKDIANIQVVKDNLSYEEYIKSLVQTMNTYHSLVFYYCTEILNQYKAWLKAFKIVQTFYAVKCNPDKIMMKLMAGFPGMCFDCASKEECGMCMSEGIKPENIIFANPTKSVENILYMARMNIWCGTLDSVDEVEKMHNVLGEKCSKLKIVIRLNVDDSNAIIKLGSKYGCTILESEQIMQVCKKYNMQVVGVAFHVGSGNTEMSMHRLAIRDAARVFELGKKYGFKMNLLDLGGGWEGILADKDLNSAYLSAVSESVLNAFHEFKFDEIEDMKYISEPGRYYNSDVIHVVCFVTNVMEHEGRRVYRINEGVNGVFKDLILTHHMDFIIQPLKEGECVESSIIGPSGQEDDIIRRSVMLPRMEVGDAILFKNIGAYTVSLTSLPLRSNQSVYYLIRESSLTSE